MPQPSNPFHLSDEWIGPYPWRTLLYAESAALRHNTGFEPVQSGHPAPEPFPKYTAQDLNAVSVAPGLSAVFLGGRAFLMGEITKSKVEKALEWFQAAQGPTIPANVVLMEWRDDFWEGMTTLVAAADAYRKNKENNNEEFELTFWFSSLVRRKIYDALVRLENKKNRGAEALELLEYALDADKQEKIYRSSAQTENGKWLYIAHFEDHWRFAFDAQIEIILKHALTCSPFPRLYVQFRLFSTYLTVYADLADMQLAPQNGPAPIQNPTFYQQKCLACINAFFPDISEKLSASINKRLGEINEANATALHAEKRAFYDAPSQMYRHVAGQAGFLHFHPQQVTGGDQETAADDKGLSGTYVSVDSVNMSRVVFHPEKRVPEPREFHFSSAPTIDQPVGKLKNSKDRIKVVIGCGGRHEHLGGILAANRRVRLSIASSDTSGGEHPPQSALDTSLLGLKLWQFFTTAETQEADEWLDRRIWLLISPWTERIIELEATRVQLEYEALTGKKTKAEFGFLRQMVTPHVFCKKTEARETAFSLYREKKDGAFIYDITGHFDLLRALSGPRVREKLGAEGYLYFTNYNNVGINVDSGMRSLASILNAVGKSKGTETPLAVFELQPYTDKNQQGSYWVNSPNRPERLLMKPEYAEFQPIHQSDWSGQLIKNGFMISTGSFVLDLKALADFWPQKLAQAPFIPRIVSINEGRYNFQRDLDQMTHFCYCVASECEERRFFPIKSEKDLYTKRYKRLQELYAGFVARLNLFRRPYPPDTFLLASSVEKNDVWGGERIRRERGMPRSRSPVSETWEVSLYPKATSHVYINALQAMPLSEIADDEKADLIMVKFLDCNNWLSVQLHPAQEICERLNQYDFGQEGEWSRRFRMAGKGSQVSPKDFQDHLSLREDDWGKEEIFYVIDLEKQTRNYIIGFNRVELETIIQMEYVVPCLKSEEISKEQLNALTEKLNLFSLEKFVDITAGKHGEVHVDLQRVYHQKLESILFGYLPLILDLRGEKDVSWDVLTGMLFIFGIWALRETMDEVLQNSANNPPLHDKVWQVIRTVFPEKNPQLSPLFKYFYKSELLCSDAVVHIPPGVIHAAGPGLFMIEMSNQSDNTFRIFDHGREFGKQHRNLHYVLAALCLAPKNLVDHEMEKNYVVQHPTRIAGESIYPEFLNSEQLKNGHVRNIGPGEEYTFICAMGNVRAKVMDPTTNRKSGLSIKKIQSAYLPKANYPRVITLEALSYEGGKGILLPARMTHHSARLGITVGLTHFEFAFSRPAGLQHHLSMFWHEIFGAEKKVTWEQYMNTLMRALEGFLGKHCNPQTTPIEAVVSWSGFVFQNSENVTEFGTEAFGGTKTQAKLEGAIRAFAPKLTLKCVLFDADADARVEASDWLGKFVGLKPEVPYGLLVNVSSGVCVQILDARQNPRTIGQIPAHSNGGTFWFQHLGRVCTLSDSRHPDYWAFDETWNLFTQFSELKERQSKIDNTPGDKKESKQPDKTARVSHFLSVTGIVLRFLWKIYKHDKTLFGEKFDNLTDSTLKTIPKSEVFIADWEEIRKKMTAETGFIFSEMITEYRTPLNLLAKAVFEMISKEMESNDGGVPGLCRDFVREAGINFSTLLAALLKRIGEFDQSMAESCAQNIVLAGFGGALFSKPGAGNQPDPFIALIQRQLAEHFDKVRVQHAETHKTTHRLLSVFAMLDNETSA